MAESTKLKFGYYPFDQPPNCVFNRSSYMQTKTACKNYTKIIPEFVYVEYLFAKDAEMVPMLQLGNFSSTGYMTSNVSAHQALQFGTIDGMLFRHFYIAADRFEHVSFAHPFREAPFCLLMNNDAVIQHAEASDNFFWLRPFTIVIIRIRSSATDFDI